MTVKEFIESLKECDENAQVLVSMDAEGNQYMKIDDVYTGYFLPKSEYERTARFDEVNTYGVSENEEEEYDKTPEQLGSKDVVCVIIYPI